jgi:hypothetical protein
MMDLVTVWKKVCNVKTRCYDMPIKGSGLLLTFDATLQQSNGDPTPFFLLGYNMQFCRTYRQKLLVGFLIIDLN